MTKQFKLESCQQRQVVVSLGGGAKLLLMKSTGATRWGDQQRHPGKIAPRDKVNQGTEFVSSDELRRGGKKQKQQ